MSTAIGPRSISRQADDAINRVSTRYCRASAVRVTFPYRVRVYRWFTVGGYGKVIRMVATPSSH